MTTDAVQLGTDATEEAVKIGIKAINNVPKILEEKVSFAQGVGKTIQETSGQVKEVWRHKINQKIGGKVSFYTIEIEFWHFPLIFVL